MFENKKAILFDLDGTLIDSAPDLAVALNGMLDSLGYPTYNAETIRGWVGNGAQILVKRGLSGNVSFDNNLDEALVAKALDKFMEFYAAKVCVKTKFYENVHKTIDILKYDKYQLAIVTNKPHRFIAPIMQTLGLGSAFDVYVGGDTLSVRKPDPMPLVYACEQLGVRVEEALMVGDSRNDMLAAKAAMMDVVGVTYGYNYGEDISIYEPDAIVSDFEDIAKLLKK